MYAYTYVLMHVWRDVRMYVSVYTGMYGCMKYHVCMYVCLFVVCILNAECPMRFYDIVFWIHLTNRSKY